MKILVLGGMHGNEPLGPAVVQLFWEKPVDNITAMLANEQAIQQVSRFVKNDLNRSFPGELSSKDYETKRAAELLQITKKYDLVLDFHNTHCPDNDCGFVGKDATSELYGAALKLGFGRIIVADYDCINKYAPNCLSVEVSLSSQLNSPRLWYQRISLLAQAERLGVDRPLERFAFVYRITLADRDRLRLANENLRAFQSISPDLAKKLQVKSPAYPIFIADKYTPYNYGGLLNRLY